MEAALFILGLFALGFVGLHGMCAWRNHVWAAFADRRGGFISKLADVKGGFLSAKVDHGSHLGRLFEHKVGVTIYTEFQLHLAGANGDGFRLVVFPDSLVHMVSKLFGMEDLVVGDARFDTLFVVQANDPDLLPVVLGDKARSALTRLYRKVGPRGFHISLDPFWFRVKREGHIWNVDDLDVFYDQCTALLDRLKEGLTPVEVLSGKHRDSASLMGATAPHISISGSTKTEEAICQVCGEIVKEDGVACVLCQTPHHADCWAYAERCSTFGCTSIRAL